MQKMQIQLKSFTSNMRMNKKCDFCNFDHGIVGVAIRTGLTLIENDDLL